MNYSVKHNREKEKIFLADLIYKVSASDLRWLCDLPLYVLVMCRYILHPYMNN